MDAPWLWLKLYTAVTTDAGREVPQNVNHDPFENLMSAA